MTAAVPGLVVPRRFRGPERSGNGGWTAGSLADLVDPQARPPTVEVTLRRPPPLDTPMTVTTLPPGDPRNPRPVPLTVLALPAQGDDDGNGDGSGDGSGGGSGDGDRVAEAREVDTALTPVERVGEEEAAAASGRYGGLRGHPFPGCFACGTDRAEGDGLRIFPGPVGADTVAARWLPDRSLAASEDLVDRGLARVDVPTTWAALDCVGGWSEDLEGRPMVLGRITVRVDALPVVGEPHVVVGQGRGREGRKTFTAATLYDADGRVVATAEHVWIAVDPAAFR